MEFLTHISVDEAFQFIDSTIQDFGVEIVPIYNALGRILAEEIYADRDFPPFDRVAMDGIAINSSNFDLNNRTFHIEGIAQAGSPQVTLQNKSNCVEVMTGCILPVNCDAVIRYEDLDIQGQLATINIDDIKSYQNVHRQGLDKEKGSCLIKSGAVINAPIIAVAATVGKHLIKVRKHPKVVIISTGNELVAIEDKPLPYQIRKSNVFVVQSILKRKNIDADLIHLNDDYPSIHSQLKNILEEYDLLIMSGGVSMGKFDFIPKALDALGVETLFHKVTERPGKPFWFGAYKKSTTIFALPGNPISTTMCAQVYLNHWIEKSIGYKSNKIEAILATDVIFKPDLTYFLEVNVTHDKDGKTIAHPKKGNGSGDLANLVGIDGFIELPKGKDLYPKGNIYRVYLFE